MKKKIEDRSKEKVFMGALALGVVTSGTGLAYMVLSGKVRPENELTYFIMGYIMAQSDRVLNYYFGSSKGSADKTDVIIGDRYNNEVPRKSLPPMSTVHSEEAPHHSPKKYDDKKDPTAFSKDAEETWVIDDEPYDFTKFKKGVR